MSQLREALDDYPAIRNSLGFKLRLPASLLYKFVAFVEKQGASHITTEIALQWAQEPVDAQPSTWSWRLGMVRRFAAWRSASDPRTEVPPAGLLPYRYHRKSPYIYTDDEINKIMKAAGKLRSSRGLRAHMYSTLFGLLTVTGMRINEALNLDLDDVQLVDGILNIRQTKFGKSRLIPLHVSTLESLKHYAGTRGRLLPNTSTQAFFVSERGTRITEYSARYTFAKLPQQIGLRASAKGHGRGPRLHDMRHRFAAKTLVNWYRSGIDVEREIPRLATYLGHVHINDTYWYLESVPELLQLATERVTKRKEAGL
jgi:integrase/recombinase XerD